MSKRWISWLSALPIYIIAYLILKSGIAGPGWKRDANWLFIAVICFWFVLVIANLALAAITKQSDSDRQ